MSPFYWDTIFVSLGDWCLAFQDSMLVSYLRVEMEMFTLICRWADKFCLHYNIFIYIRHIWIKPVLCSCMVSLFHHTSPWTHRCLQGSPSAHRNGRVFRRSVQTACCYWILNCGKFPSIETHRWMQAIYGDQCVDVSTVRCSVRRFKDGELGQADLND